MIYSRFLLVLGFHTLNLQTYLGDFCFIVSPLTDFFATIITIFISITTMPITSSLPSWFLLLQNHQHQLTPSLKFSWYFLRKQRVIVFYCFLGSRRRCAKSVQDTPYSEVHASSYSHRAAAARSFSFSFLPLYSSSIFTSGLGFGSRSCVLL